MADDKDKAQREKILDRVRAMLSMTVANGCTEAEAMVAAEKAAALMEEYDLAFSDAQAVRDEAVGQQTKPYPEHTNPQILHTGAHWTMVPIADFFDCKTWYNSNTVVFFGIKSDAELAHQLQVLVCLAMDSELLAWSTGTGTKGLSGNR